MLTMLVDSLPEEIAALQAAYQLKDWEQLKAIAHKLKGGASYCGTLRLKSACTELETYVKSGLTDRITELYQQLLAEIDAVKTEIHHQKFVD
jgi:FOG: HPt domain